MITEDFKQKCEALEKKAFDAYYDDNAQEPLYDGIVDIDTYLTSKYRILWILKEPYDNDDPNSTEGGGWHLCKDFLAKDGFYYKMGDSWRTWQPVVYVSYGILNKFAKFDDMPWLRDDPEMANIIRNVAVINVKKIPGGKRTYDYSIIRDSYNRHKDILHEQIKLYNPHIIIGGATMDLFFQDLGISSEDIKSNNSVRYAVKDGKIYLAAYHPAQTTVKREIYVDDIITTVEAYMKK